MRLRYRDGPRMVATWYGPLPGTRGLDGWQAEYFTPRTFYLFGVPIWRKRVEREPVGIIQAIFGRR